MRVRVRWTSGVRCTSGTVFAQLDQLPPHQVTGLIAGLEGMARRAVCLIDTDWEWAVLDGVPDQLVTTLVRHLFGQVMLHHRGIGRSLRRRAVRAGLVDVTATPVTCCFLESAGAAAVLPMVNPRVPREAGMIPEEIRDEWFAAIDAAGARDEFLAAVTIWVVAGTRPA